MLRTVAAWLMAGSLIGLTVLLSAPAQTTGQNRDSRVDGLIKQMDQLTKQVSEQGQRIASLEKEVKALQTPPPPPQPASIPAPVPAWYSATNWSMIKPGMSEAQVTEILGAPTSVQTVEDTRKLFYGPDPHSTNTLAGSLTLMDDRVIAMTPPTF